tara:strand:+ start:20 stop:475 length:456 start_codon:yes stop_codon:yes gene_type:complete
MNDLEITNKNWIQFGSSSNGRCVLEYNVGELKKAKNEEADISYVIMIVRAAIEITNKNMGEKNHTANVRLKNLNLSSYPIKLTIKAIKILQTELVDCVFDLNVYDVDKKYLFVWDTIKSFVDKDTLQKITIYTTDGKKLNSVENLEKNLNN